MGVSIRYVDYTPTMKLWQTSPQIFWRLPDQVGESAAATLQMGFDENFGLKSTRTRLSCRAHLFRSSPAGSASAQGKRLIRYPVPRVIQERSHGLGGRHIIRSE